MMDLRRLSPVAVAAALCAAAANAGVKWTFVEGTQRDFARVFAAQTGEQALPASGADEAALRFHVGAKCAMAKSLGLDFETLHPYGYYLAKRGRDVLFAGRNAKGDSYAAFDFLKRFAGYRNFGGEFGLIAPAVAELHLPDEFTFREEPDILSYRCQWCPAFEPFCRSDRMTIQATHAMDQMVTKDLYDEHPEYFPLVAGERVAPGLAGRPWNPCMSNPDLPALFRGYARRYLAAHPEALSVPMGVNDGGGDCNCEQCLDKFRRHGNQYVEFYNEAARILQEEAPGKLLAFIGYSARCGKAPSDGYLMESNVLVEVTGNIGNYAEWRAAGVRNFGTYEYLYQLGAARIAPASYPHRIAAFIRSLHADTGMKSLWTECFAKSSVFDGARQYVTDELAWNLDADVDALLDDYCASLYGAAAGPMRRFLDVAEKAFSDNRSRKTFFTEYRNPIQFEGYTFERIAAMDAALAEAAATPGTTETQRERIRIVASYWGLARLFADNWQCALLIPKADDLQQVAALAHRGFGDIAEIASLSLSPEDEIWASTEGRPGLFEMLKGISVFAPLPPLETAIDTALRRFVETNGADTARTALAALAADPAMRPYAETQLALSDGTATDVALNGGFEEGGATPPSDRQNEGDWEPLGVAAWNWSRFPSTQAKAWADTSEAHSGKRSVAIGANPLGCWVVTQIKAEPNSRYRASVWAKGNSTAKVLGSLSVRMKDASGQWLDDGTAISVDITDASSGHWARHSVSFTTPDRDGDVWLVPILSSQTGAKEEARLWFDDFKMEMTGKTSPALVGQVEFAQATLRRWLSGWRVELPELVRDDGLGEGAFKAERRADGSVAISGGEEGLRIGLYAWAHSLGVRWFSPAEEPLVPQSPAPIPDSFWGLHEPTFRYRGFHTCGARLHFDPRVAHWMSFNGMNRRLDTLAEAWENRRELSKFGLKSDTTVHSFDTLVPPAEFFATHPEWFPEIGGRRSATGGQRCLANAEFRDKFAERLGEWMAKVPDAAAYGICPNDGYGWCECAACRALDTDEDRRNGTVNGRMADFVADMCARFPDKTIGNYSYSNFRDFYKTYRKIPGNLLLSMTVSHCQGHSLADSACPANSRIWPIVAQLAEKGARFYLYDYYTYLWDGLPAPMWKTVEADIGALRGIGCSGFISEVCAHDHDSWDGFAPALYVAARLLYDADLGADAVIDDWCDMRYGAAAEAMKRYFREWEKGIPLDRCFMKRPEDFARIFRSDAKAPLDEAARLAPENRLVAKSRQLFDAWSANLKARSRYPVVREVSVHRDFARIPIHFVRNSTQLPDEKNRTQLEMKASDGALVMRLTLFEGRMWNLKTAKGDISASDSVELFFDDGDDPKTCYHFIVDTTGELQASKCRGTDWNWNWDHGAKAVVSKQSNAWVVEFELPLADIHALDGFGFSVVRNRFAGGKWEIFGAPAGGAYFTPSDYIRALVDF